ncbi:MAG: glutathione S-transferase [Alphaproteobacteria bacterium]|jgi:glutathione S-transferase|nr:glutathione S-transferase [Alphaproteobacteria bacterium]
MTLKLVIGNKNYSSWSLRPWIAMKVADIPFQEQVIPLYEADSPRQIRELSPAGKVPILIDDDIRVWESLAIIEYLADKFPDAKLWPSDAQARAHARVLAAEMHAGFSNLRRHCPMNVRRPVKPRELTPEVLQDVKRIEEMWNDSRARFGKNGPFLCGAFGAVDAMYAPIVSRFHTYKIEGGATARTYMDAVMALPAWTDWAAAARSEAWVLPHCEVD